MTPGSHTGQEEWQVAEDVKMFLRKTVQDCPQSLIHFFLFWICKIHWRTQSDLINQFCCAESTQNVHSSPPQLHLPLNTFSSCVLCGSGISPPGNSLRKSFSNEARVGISSLSNSGTPPWSKLFLNSWQRFTFPPTLNRPLSLRPKHKHTFYKHTQSQHTSDKHWETLSNTHSTHHASPQTPLCAWALEEDPASSVHSSSGRSGAHQTQLSVFPAAQVQEKFRKNKQIRKVYWEIMYCKECTRK